MTILCSLQNMNLSFGEKIIFDQAKLTINQGDKIGLIGLNGHGKSTLFNILSDKVTPDISTPPFIFDKNSKNFDLFYIPQELDLKSFPDLNIKNYYLAFYPELLKTHRELERVQASLAEDYSNEKLLDRQQDLLEKFEALQGWDIENSYLSYIQFFELQNEDKDLNLLSGGEQRKMALSIGLSTKANFILWDEPTNHLDVETIEKFEDELNSTQKTFIVISHDRYLLNHVTTKIVHIERGSITSFEGTYLEYLEYLEEKEKELQKNLDKLENKHRRELAWMRQGVKARRTRSKKRVEGFENIKQDIGELKSRSKKVVDLNLFHSGRKTKQLIEIQEGSFGFDNKEIFKDLNIVINKKDKIALIGPNGAGKTTLLNILNDSLKINSGNLKRAEDLKIITFDQKRKDLDPNKSLIEIVGDGQDFVTLGNGKSKHVVSYLESFLFTKNQINQPVSTLSGGERNRLQLAMFMKQTADIWVFDEPTNDLDIETIELLEAELKSYDAAVIIVGHDRAFLDNVCNSTWLLHDKHIEIFEGGYAQIAPYLHALELEKKLKNESPKKEDHKSSSSEEKESKKEKMSYKEKKRWQAIESEIANTEEQIDHLKKEMENYDFSSSTIEQNKQYELKHKKLAVSEEKLLELMNEWEILAEKEE